MTYVVVGRAHPERANINISDIEIEISESEWMRVRCESSQLAINLCLNELDDTSSAFYTAEHYARTFVSALGFALGNGYSVEMIQVIDTQGVASVFGVAPHELGFENFLDVFSGALDLSLRDLNFRLAVHDYVSAITEVLDCATYCYRAIEAIKAAFVFRTGRNRWDDMHSALGTDRQMITEIVKTYADPVRHGNWPAVRSTSSSERKAMLTLTRDILRRYLEHMKADVTSST